jgi:hypothetical protein
MAPEAALLEVVKDRGGARVPLMPTRAVSILTLSSPLVDDFARETDLTTGISMFLVSSAPAMAKPSNGLRRPEPMFLAVKDGFVAGGGAAPAPARCESAPFRQ